MFIIQKHTQTLPYVRNRHLEIQCYQEFCVTIPSYNIYKAVHLGIVSQYANNQLFIPTAPSDSSLLVIIVDTNPNQRYITEDPKVLTGCLDAVISFANSHLMQKARNQLAVIGCHFHKRFDILGNILTYLLTSKHQWLLLHIFSAVVV